jgi:hypothetical protein
MTASTLYYWLHDNKSLQDTCVTSQWRASCLVTTSTESNRSWDTNSSSAIQEFINILRKLTVHYRVNSNQPLVLILSMLNPVHTSQSPFSKIRLVMLSHACVCLPNGIFPSEFATESYMNSFHSHMCYMLCPSRPPELITKIIFIEEYKLWTSYNFIPLRSIFDRICGLVVKVPGYRSRGPGFGSRRYQIFWEVVGLERGPLCLVSTIEELLGRKSSGPGLESREYGRRDPSRWPLGILHPQKLALTSPTSCSRSVDIVRYSSLSADLSKKSICTSVTCRFTVPILLIRKRCWVLF